MLEQEIKETWALEDLLLLVPKAPKMVAEEINSRESFTFEKIDSTLNDMFTQNSGSGKSKYIWWFSSKIFNKEKGVINPKWKVFFKHLLSGQFTKELSAFWEEGSLSEKLSKYNSSTLMNGFATSLLIECVHGKTEINYKDHNYSSALWVPKDGERFSLEILNNDRILSLTPRYYMFKNLIESATIIGDREKTDKESSLLAAEAIVDEASDLNECIKKLENLILSYTTATNELYDLLRETLPHQLSSALLIYGDKIYDLPGDPLTGDPYLRTRMLDEFLRFPSYSFDYEIRNREDFPVEKFYEKIGSAKFGSNYALTVPAKGIIEELIEHYGLEYILNLKQESGSHVYEQDASKPIPILKNIPQKVRIMSSLHYLYKKEHITFIDIIKLLPANTNFFNLKATFPADTLEEIEKYVSSRTRAIDPSVLAKIQHNGDEPVSLYEMCMIAEAF